MNAFDEAALELFEAARGMIGHMPRWTAVTRMRNEDAETYIKRTVEEDRAFSKAKERFQRERQERYCKALREMLPFLAQAIVDASLPKPEFFEPVCSKCGKQYAPGAMAYLMLDGSTMCSECAEHSGLGAILMSAPSGEPDVEAAHDY